MTEQERREECRREVRAFLVSRSVLAYRAETIVAKLLKEHNFILTEVRAALEFEVGRGHVSVTPDPDGATPYYKITPEGILFHERNP